jgi:hypothetical protein
MLSNLYTERVRAKEGGKKVKLTHDNVTDCKCFHSLQIHILKRTVGLFSKENL